MIKNSFLKITFAVMINLFFLIFSLSYSQNTEKTNGKYDYGFLAPIIKKGNCLNKKNDKKGLEIMKKLPLGLQTFSKVINDEYIYVDKTKYIYELINENCVFFARPHCFGKSLLCSTLKELFSGNRDLFKGLWIEKNTDYVWPEHPVISLDLSQVDTSSSDLLNEGLIRQIDNIAKFYNLKPLTHASPAEMLVSLTMRLFKKFGSKNRVVIIVDEYDKPILDNIDKIEVARSMHDVLRTFYGVIKPLDEYLKFVFITGTTHISMASMFSGMNHLKNISMDPKYAHLVGYTQDEISFYFNKYLERIAFLNKISLDCLIEKFNAWYGGYCFCIGKDVLRERLDAKKIESLYAPCSILNFLDKEEFKNYWFESGTPSCLIKVLEHKKYPIESFKNLKADSSELMTLDIENISLATLLFMMGYSTIKGYDALYRYYSLDLPNYEVKDSIEILFELLKYKTGQFLYNKSAG